MSIPAFKKNGELPVGEHQASLSEIENRFGKSTEKRKNLMKKLKSAAKNLKSAGVKRIWIDGSFVTDKPEPSDIDGCWDTAAVDPKKLDPVFLKSRVAIKQKYDLDFFMSHIIEADSGLPFPQFFQKNDGGDPKGIVVVKLNK